MAWPRCSSCKLGPVPRVETGQGCDGEDVAVVRSYRCPCGWSGWTAEVLISERPGTVYVREKGGPWLLIAFRDVIAKWVL